MIGLILNKMMDELARRCFTCSMCEKVIKGGYPMTVLASIPYDAEKAKGV